MSPRLDALARELASESISRRSGLKRLAAVAAGGAAALAPGLGTSAEARKRCPKKRRCGDKCCPKGARCRDGKCKCKHGKKKCGERCVDRQTDTQHCGACNNQCGPGQPCVDGICRDAGSHAPVGVVNVADFGAQGDGATDDRTAIQAAIDTVKTAGGTVFFPRGTYLVDGALNLDDSQGLVLLGDGGGFPGSTGSILSYPGTAEPLILAGSADGLQVRQLTLRYTNSGFDKDLVDFGWSSDRIADGNPNDHTGSTDSDAGNILFDSCTFRGTSASVTNARSLVRLNRVIFARFNHCRFERARIGLLGQDPNYANVIQVNRCGFRTCVTAPIAELGESWQIQNCSFTGLLGTFGQAVLISSGQLVTGLDYRGNWHGDADNDAAIWFNHANGILSGATIEGNFFASHGAGGQSIRLDDQVQGCLIAGNRIEGPTGINVSTGQSAVKRGIVILANDISAGTNSIGAIQSGLVAGNLGLNPTTTLTFDHFAAAATPNASTVGSVVRKMEVFDEAGNSVGFVPIYDSIA